MRLLCHLLILLAAFHWTHSVSGFLVTGPGLALLLDRYALRLLPWAIPVAWPRELAVRAGYFLLGAAGFYLMRPGIVPWWEAVYRGLMVSLLAFLVDALVGMVSRGRAGLWLRGLLLGLLVVVLPVVAALHPLHTVPKRTPAALGLAFEDVRFHTADGVQLAGWVVPHPHARGNLIFCHGHGRNRGHVAGLLPTFHQLGLNVLAFDFRGHGDSEGHTSTFGDREVHDLVAAQAYLARRFPGQPLFLVGISLGAAVSLQALPRLGDVHGVWSEGAYSQLDHAVVNTFRWLPGWVCNPLVGFYYRLGWLDCGFWGPAVNPVDALDHLNVPIYFCHARRDELVPCAEGQALFQRYAGPRWHWWVEDATHYNIRQRHPDEYLQRLRAFLESHLTG